jgi:iron complex outermembrane recepter protein
VLTLHASYSYVDAHFTSTPPSGNILNVLQGVPAHQASASAQLDLPASFGKWQLGANVSYTSRVDYQPNNHLLVAPGQIVAPLSATVQKGYALLDARAGVHIDAYDLDVAVWAKNLTNKYYVAGALDVTGSGLGVISDFIGQRRTFGIELIKSF